MERRQVLTSLAIGISMGTISGCLDLGEDTRALGDSAVFSTEKNTFVLQVAFTSISLVLELRNGASRQRTIWLRILDRLAKDVAHKASSAMPAEKQLLVTLEPSRYYVQLWGPAINTETVSVRVALR